MNQQKVILLVTAQTNPMEKEALQEYVNISGGLFKAAGGKLINKYLIDGQFIGNNPMNLVSITEFPNVNAITEVFNNDAYKALLPLRELAFLKLEAYVSKV